MPDAPSLRDRLIDRWVFSGDDLGDITDDQLLARLEELVGEGWHAAGMELQRREGDVRYLVERIRLDAGHHGLTGISSDALVVAAFTGYAPAAGSYPRDRADWRRCLVAYALAPAWLRDRMRPVMRDYRAALDRRYWAWGCKHPRPADIEGLAAWADRVEAWNNVGAGGTTIRVVPSEPAEPQGSLVGVMDEYGTIWAGEPGASDRIGDAVLRADDETSLIYLEGGRG